MSKNSKNFKLMNVVMVICVIIFGEVFAYLNDLYLGARLHNGKLFAPYSMKIEKFSTIYQNAWKKGFGKEYGADFKERPIVIFGGSYAFGYGLQDEETLSAQLSDFIKKPVYNRAFQAWCVQNMLWQLKREDIYNEIKNPEFAIYLGVNADLESVYNPDILNGLRYRESNGELKEVPFPFMLLNYSYLYKKINHEISYRKTLNPSQNMRFFNKHLIEAKKEIDKHWKNCKMIVIWYDVPEYDEFSELEKVGIKVVSLNDFMKREILSNDEFKNSGIEIHPTAKVWQAIVPELVKRAEL